MFAPPLLCMRPLLASAARASSVLPLLVYLPALHPDISAFCNSGFVGRVHRLDNVSEQPQGKELRSSRRGGAALAALRWRCEKLPSARWQKWPVDLHIASIVRPLTKSSDTHVSEVLTFGGETCGSAAHAPCGLRQAPGVRYLFPPRMPLPGGRVGGQ